ncbi:Hpt domain-containing protein [Erythrobacter sp. EC-HK427]|uniref:Hpt domain-containing protein n=1 Tax=Erythrobacter sp. EC-HK427 TaxID=2038396 RepID=UPI00125F39C3|nr:Hpt domain-containing protein [Erythrobacter sp. EC-HK427]
MAYEQGDFELALTAAAGDDMALIAELRASFLESLEAQITLLSRARCDGNWDVAAHRLKGLGASFHAGELARLAQEAIDGAPGDPAVLRKLRELHLRFSAAD